MDDDVTIRPVLTPEEFENPVLPPELAGRLEHGSYPCQKCKCPAPSLAQALECERAHGGFPRVDSLGRTKKTQEPETRAYVIRRQFAPAPEQIYPRAPQPRRPALGLLERIGGAAQEALGIKEGI